MKKLLTNYQIEADLMIGGETLTAHSQIANLEALLIVKDAQINNLKDLVELYKKSEQRLEEELTNKK